MKSRTLTLNTLIAKGACADQCALFERLFGQSVQITPELAAKYADKFMVEWAARHLLSSAAQAEYERVKASAWAEYKRVTAPAWAEYERVKASALAEYERVKASAWATCYINDKN